MNNIPKNNNRASAFRRNLNLEELLNNLNEVLWCAEEQLLLSPSKNVNKFPIIFIMGPLRSGTTLFMQWLAQSGLVAYPSNLLSRFYGVPIVGAYIQLLITDPRFNFRNEIFDFNSPISFESENGKTKGALAPNEFWYFWRRFLPFKKLDWMPDDELFASVDTKTLVAELTALTRVFSKPFALKGMILNYNIPFLDSIFQRALFIQIKREPIANVASIIDARKRQFGNKNQWYSFKIPEYYELKDHDTIFQCAGQLYFINKAITTGMNTVKEDRKLLVNYEDFCRQPKKVFEKLLLKLGLEKSVNYYNGPELFKQTRIREVDKKTSIEKAWNHFLNKDGL